MALSCEELKSTLWEAANILRGPAVDRTDWKGYILPLPDGKKPIQKVTTEEAGHISEPTRKSSKSRYPENIAKSLPSS